MVEAFTYEDIYELVRAEKFSTDLQVVKLADLEKIKAYLTAKHDLLNKQQQDMTVFSSQKRAKLHLEIDNARRALKDLYERRERKIINRAFFSTRSDSQLLDTSNMLANEEQLYKVLVDLLSRNKEKFFALLEGPQDILGPQKEVEIMAPEKLEKDISPQEHLIEESHKEEKEKPPEPKTKEEKPIEVDSPQRGLVKFLEEVPEFVGEDLKNYGPFKIGDIAKIPHKIIGFLHKEKKVEHVKDLGLKPKV